MIASALKLSIVVSLAATVLVAVAGTIAARLMTRRSFRGRALLDAALNLPLVLPPTVTGYYLIVLLGRRGWLGGPLFEATGWSITFTWAACVLAAAVMSFPLMYRAARVAFEEVDGRHEVAAASLGHAPLSVFLRVSLPLARRGLTAGVTLSFARSLGEFGATLLISRPEYPTIPVAIERFLSQPGGLNYGQAMAMASILMLLTTASILLIEKFRLPNSGEF